MSISSMKCGLRSAISTQARKSITAISWVLPCGGCRKTFSRKTATRSSAMFLKSFLIERSRQRSRLPNNPASQVWYLFPLAMKRSNRIKLKLREVQMVLEGLLSTKHPLLAHIIPTRRCNLTCGYCNEYDDFSPPIPIDTMLRRIDLLAGLRTAVVTLSGGEPLLHPQVEAIIGRIRHHGMIAGVITNGYLLTPQKIRALNDAGLEHLQISIDNIQPDDVSMKSLKVLDKKLEFLAEHAEFAVNINSVIGGGIRNPEDAIAVTKRAVGFGFASSLGIIHDHMGG